MLRVRDEPLVDFSFSSQIAEDTSPEALLRLVQQAWSHNRRANVSGFLRVSGTAIEQSVEGRSATILALAARILTDPRHCRLVVRSFAPIAARGFATFTVEGLAPAVQPTPPFASTHPRLRLLACADVPPANAPAAPLAIARLQGGRPAS